jgi:VWFA-related protein
MMGSMRSSLLLAIAAAVGAPQQTPAPPPQSPAAAPSVIGVTASRVAVDLVVRDKRGRVVHDLTPAEFEVFEDGARQEVLSLRLLDTLGGARAEGAPPSAAPSPAEDEPLPLLVAFLFDRLTPQARQTAHDAAFDWLRQPPPRQRQIGVYRVDETLIELQPFTDDTSAVREGVERALGAAPTGFASRSDRERIRGLRSELVALGPPPGQEGASPAGGSPAAVSGPVGAESSGREIGRSMDALRGAAAPDRATASVEYARLRLELGILEATEALERDQQGLSTVNALMALVNGLKNVRGRKAIVFFSEGLVVPPRVAQGLQAVVAEANRGGVTFYAADAAGLRTTSASNETRRDLTSSAQMTDAATIGSAASGQLLKNLERMEDIMRSDPHASLDGLARQTGGFLVSDTNDIAKSLNVAQEDLASYYLLEYSPTNELWDGSFRRIEVRTKRPGLRVQARQGYFAVRTAMPTPVLGFEAPVLAAVELAPRAQDMAFRAAVVQVPDEKDESAVPVLVEIPGDAPTLEANQKEKSWQQDFTALVLVRDEQGRVVRKLSRRLAASGALATADEVKRSRMLVLRETWLPAGRYTVEIAVRDALSGRLGVQRLPLDVPGAGSSLRVSSLVIVGHASKPDQGPSGAPCLLSQGLQIYPNASSVSLSSGKPLPFFLVARSGRAAPTGRVELVREEQAVFSAPIEFQQASGRATVLAGVPLQGLSPGDYQLRAVVGDGTDEVVRWARVTLVP